MSAFLEGVRTRATALSRRIAFPESADPRTLEAVKALKEKRIVEPVLVLDPRHPESHERALALGLECVSPEADDRATHVAATLLQLRKRKGLTAEAASLLASDPLYFADWM